MKSSVHGNSSLLVATHHYNGHTWWRGKQQHCHRNQITANVSLWKITIIRAFAHLCHNFVCRTSSAQYAHDVYRFIFLVLMSWCCSHQLAHGEHKFNRICDRTHSHQRRRKICIICICPCERRNTHISMRRNLTFLPLISHVMCGAGCAFDVVQFADSFSPTVNSRLLNVMRGGPVCCAENYNISFNVKITK